MPEEPTLTHVATTLQFCLEQLELCVLETDKIQRGLKAGMAGTTGVLLENAIANIKAALNRLSMDGIEPAPLASEGSPA